MIKSYWRVPNWVVDYFIDIWAIVPYGTSHKINKANGPKRDISGRFAKAA